MVNGIRAGEQRDLFGSEGVFLSAHGGGAGNNWASGYHQAQTAQEDLLDMLGEWEVGKALRILLGTFFHLSHAGKFSVDYTK